MAKNPFYYRCCVTRRIIPFTKKIEWHHNLQGGHGQINEEWCILPLAEEVHRDVSNPKIKYILNWIMLNRATDNELKVHSKLVNLIEMREMVNKRIGVPWHDGIDVIDIMYKIFPI